MKTYWKIFCCLPLFLLPTVAEAQSGSEAQAYRDYLNGTSAIVVRVDSSRLELPTSLTDTSKSGVNAEMVRGIAQDMRWLNSQLDGEPMYVMVDVPYSKAQPPFRLLIPSVEQDKQKELTEKLVAIGMIKPIWNQQFAEVTLAEERYKNWKANQITDQVIPRQSELFDEAMDSISNYPVQIAFVPPAYLWRTYDELVENLPRQLGGGPMKRVTEGIQWAAIGLNPKEMEITLTVQSNSPGAADALAPFLPELLINLINEGAGKRARNVKAVTAAVLPLLKPKVQGDRIVWNLDIAENEGEAIGIFVKLADVLLTPVMGRDVTTKLKQLALAIHNHESGMGSLPPAQKARGEDGQSGLSWRVHILPYLGELELYKQFNLDEPWDSEHNKPLLDRVPDIYQTGSFSLLNRQSKIPSGYTTFVAPVGEGTIFGGDEVVTFGRVTDGLSNTVMIVEVKPEFAVPWTSPQDYNFDPANPALGLSDGEGVGYRAALGDGAVVIIPLTINAETMLHLFQMNDGHAVKY